MKQEKSNKLICLIDDSLISDEEARLLYDYALNLDGQFECYHLDEGTAVTGYVIEIKRDEKGWPLYIELKDKEDKRVFSRIGFLYHYYNLKDLIDRSGLSQVEFEKILITMTLASSSRAQIILATNNERIFEYLDKEIPFTSDAKDLVTNVEQAKWQIDLFLKKNHEYRIAPFFSVNKWLWYLYQCYSLIPSMLTFRYTIYNEKNQYENLKELRNLAESFLSRSTDMLYTLDEIAYLSMQKLDNDILDDIKYYFNTWAVLYCGIVDNMALIFKSIHNVAGDLKSNYIGLRKCNAQFLDIIKDTDIEMYRFVTDNQSLLSYIHDSRNLIVHNAQLHGVTYYNPKTKDKKPLICIDQKLALSIENVKKDIQNYYGIVLDFGIQSLRQDDAYIIPIDFCAAATKGLMLAVEKFLQCLMADNKIGILPMERNSDLEKTVELFKKCNLGFH